MPTFKLYLSGFILSVFFTLLAFALVLEHLLTGTALIAALIFMALIQACVQLIFFLHLDREGKPRWNLTVFASTVSIILILVIGSLWIMNHLNYNHNMSDREMIMGEGMMK